jgi:hypothetical protein
MMLFIASLLLFVASMALMALGVMLGKRPLPGSCGRRNCECRGRE